MKTVTQNSSCSIFYKKRDIKKITCAISYRICQLLQTIKTSIAGYKDIEIN